MASPASVRHCLKLSDREVTVVVRELPDRILFLSFFTKRGPFKKKKELQRYKEWYSSIIVPYDSDPRPGHSIFPDTGEALLAFNDQSALYWPPAK